jgi:thiosulfate dehydrogenase [quinone] large subunit
MKPVQISDFLKYLFTFLRIAIGWHFLYEGVAKIFTPNWSSASYLLNSSGPLAGLFQSLASNQFLVYLADYSIIFGLIIIGFALFVGLSTKVAALAGSACCCCFTYQIHL